MSNLECSPAARDALVVARYQQLHEMRRQYNLFILQVPPVVVTAIGALVLIIKDHDGGITSMLQSNVPYLGALCILVGSFVMVMGFSALKNREMLKRCEKALKEMEAQCGLPDFDMYPEDFEGRLPHWERLSSTSSIAYFVLVFGSVLFIGGWIQILFSLVSGILGLWK